MIRIRPYMDTDAQVILSWCRDEETFARWTFGILGDYPVTAEAFAKTGQYPRFTAFDEEGPVGFFIARNPGGAMDELRFGYVIVDADRRGRGIGKEMLRQGLVYAFDVYQARRVSLGVYRENAPACACYRSLGFTETGSRETYEVCGISRTAYEMEIRRPEALRQKQKENGKHECG